MYNAFQSPYQAEVLRKRQQHGTSAFAKQPVPVPVYGLLTCLPLTIRRLLELRAPLTRLLTAAAPVPGSESAQPMPLTPMMVLLLFQHPPSTGLFELERMPYVYIRGAGKKQLSESTGWNWVAFHILKSYWVSSWSCRTWWKAVFTGSLFCFFLIN